MGITTTSRWQVIGMVRSPLSFFALALLIVEGFLLGAGRLFGLSENIKMGALGVGVLLFVLVVWIVRDLVVNYPMNLVFGEASHLQLQHMRMYGHSGAPITGAVLDATPLERQPDLPTIAHQPDVPAAHAPETPNEPKEE